MFRSSGDGVALLLVLVSSFVLSRVLQSSFADRCVLPIKDVQVYGPGQKAIIAWNGRIERLILSTDLYAQADSKALEILPLPSKPTVQRATLESFQAIQNLMIRNIPRQAAAQYKGDLEVVFHEKIDTHDITVVKTASLTELVNFMLDYSERNGLNRRVVITDKTKLIVEDYLTRAFSYWVFDLVDLHLETRSLQPLAYQFQSSSLYYPLKVSSVAEGQTEVTLYLITSDPVTEDDIPLKMRLARYVPSRETVQFQISHRDLGSIDPEIQGLFPGDAWFTAVRYQGALAHLDFDLQVVPRPEPCRRISVRTNANACMVGDTLVIEVDFTHLLPGCVELAVLHHHEVRLEISNSNGSNVRTWRWRTNGDLHEVVLWQPGNEGKYTVKASSWWNGRIPEVEAWVSISIGRRELPVVGLWLIGGAMMAMLFLFLGRIGRPTCKGANRQRSGSPPM